MSAESLCCFQRRGPDWGSERVKRLKKKSWDWMVCVLCWRKHSSLEAWCVSYRVEQRRPGYCTQQNKKAELLHIEKHGSRIITYRWIKEAGLLHIEKQGSRVTTYRGLKEAGLTSLSKSSLWGEAACRP